MTEDKPDARLERLLAFRNDDPANEQLTFDCAEAALAAGRMELVQELLEELPAGSELKRAAANLAGIAAMRAGDQQTAQASFRSLLEDSPDDPSLRFNLAWSLALDGDKEGALSQLNEQSVEALPQAAMLDLQLRHEAGQWDEAAELLERHLTRHPNYPPLQAVASVLAMDIEDAELARACALKGGDHPDALTTLGMLDLGDERTAHASACFRKSLESRQKGNPRAKVGLGLANLAEGHAVDAARQLDAGAREFGDHLGSWIAAGWAHVLAGDLVAARERFQTAMEIDDNFAEAHGGLATLDAMEGDTESARRRLEVALRLDRQCFSAALAGVLLAVESGDSERSRNILETAFKQPILPDGTTLRTALARIAR